RDDGKDVIVKASQVRYIEGETMHDLSFTDHLRFVQMCKGAWCQDSNLTDGIGNSFMTIDRLVFHQTDKADERPAWAGEGRLRGLNGPYEAIPNTKIVFAAGQLKAEGSEQFNTVFSGWYQVDKTTGALVNEGFISGEPDFDWAAGFDQLDW